MVELDFYSASVNIGIILSLVTIAIIIYNYSRKQGQEAAKRESLEALHNKDIQELKEKISSKFEELTDKMQENHKESLDKIHAATIERKEDIAKAALDTKEQFSIVQKMLDSKSVEIKEVNTRVTTEGTRVENLCTDIREIKDEIKVTKDFTIDWNQRIEDRIKEAEKKADESIDCAKRDLMDTMNMLIRMRNSVTNSGNGK